MSIYYKIKAYLEKDFKLREEVSFEDDNGTITITYWNEESLGKAKPTLDKLNALETEATKLQNNEKIRIARKEAYGDIGEQLDEIYKDIDAWKARIKKIKDDNPKE